MSKVLVILGVFLSSCMSSVTTAASVLKINPKRTIQVVGDISYPSFSIHADSLIKLTEESTDPVYVVINSNGGSSAAGMQFMEAISVAQSRGVVVKCFVSSNAKSMGFYIFSACSERYALSNATLMWHPLRQHHHHIALTVDSMSKKINQMKIRAEYLEEKARKALNISKELFQYHNLKETWHTGYSIKEMSPDFIVIVDDMEGLPLRFTEMVLPLMFEKE